MKTTFSKTLLTTGSREIGLKRSTEIGLDLGTGHISAIFHNTGKIPRSNDRLKIKLRGWTMASADCFKRTGNMPSLPPLLSVFSLLKIFRTSFLLQMSLTGFRTSSFEKESLFTKTSEKIRLIDSAAVRGSEKRATIESTELLLFLPRTSFTTDQAPWGDEHILSLQIRLHFAISALNFCL